MSVDVVTHVTIARPREEVAGFAGDPSNASEWYVNIESVRWHGRPSVEVGARIDFVAHFMGRRLEYTYEYASTSPVRS